jgi:uncharacterized protein YlaN (UPF0358 family)
MSQNPLQQYFRQPKIFIKLPSHGVYNRPDVIKGDVDNMPIFGMTGMDEMLIKTPDALLTGESTARVIQSCCPGITDGWDTSNLDVDALLIAIRIATYGNIMTISTLCKNCQTESDYDIELDQYLDHFNSARFDPKVIIGNLTITIRPLSYKEATNFNLENFGIQQRLNQILTLTDEKEKQRLMSELFKELGALQTRIFIAGVVSVDTPEVQVSEHAFIKEWLENCDKSIFDTLKDHIDENNARWKMPPKTVKCDNCSHEDQITIELDQSGFFAGA